MFVCILKVYKLQPRQPHRVTSVLFTNSNLTHKKAFNIKKNNTQKNTFFFNNLKILLSVLPLCMITIKLGHAYRSHVHLFIREGLMAGGTEWHRYCINVAKIIRMILPMENQTTHEVHLFIYLLKAYSLVNRTGSPQGFSQVQISHKLNTIQNMHITYT